MPRGPMAPAEREAERRNRSPTRSIHPEICIAAKSRGARSGHHNRELRVREDG